MSSKRQRREHCTRYKTLNHEVGGLGKTKPETGVTLFDEQMIPSQNKQGVVSAEILSRSGKPVLVSFQAPWPMLTSSGLEARDVKNPESSFVQVIPAVPNWSDTKVFSQLLLESVFSKQGKFSAYGEPYAFSYSTRNKKKDGDDKILFSVSFTSLTPAMRESERKVWIKPQQVDDDTLVLLVVGTTRARFPSFETTFEKVVDSFTAVAAPESSLKKSTR